MARSLNKAQIIGNLATDPELKYIPNGSMVCTFVIASNRRYTKADGSVAEDAEFTPVAAWGKLAEVCQKILAKGMLAYVEGRLKTRSWDGPDGTKRYKTEIRALDIILLDSKGREAAGMPEGEGPVGDSFAGAPVSASTAAPSARDDKKDDKKDGKAKKDDSDDAGITDEELEEILSDGGDDDDDKKDKKEDKKK